MEQHTALIINSEKVRSEWFLPFDDNKEEGVEIIEDMITGTGRWSIRHRLIVKIKDKFYMTHYQVGATEQQYEQPWEYEEEVEFIEVEKVEKIAFDWKPIIICS